ncbi:hypothetical protein VTK73DRAFT_7052 [Phialemonium thermophilum]|uniref:Secreted protein n=1 Tax=Phialemonium thermophilum TaxID=223376 RepID=A0ABR3WH37_9PEZI
MGLLFFWLVWGVCSGTMTALPPLPPPLFSIFPSCCDPPAWSPFMRLFQGVIRPLHFVLWEASTVEHEDLFYSSVSRFRYHICIFSFLSYFLKRVEWVDVTVMGLRASICEMSKSRPLGRLDLAWRLCLYCLLRLLFLFSTCIVCFARHAISSSSPTLPLLGDRDGELENALQSSRRRRRAYGFI